MDFDFYLTECVVVKKLGKGAFGQAFLVKDPKTEALYCRKEIKLEDLSDSDKANITNEAAILSQFNHRNVVRYYASGFTVDKFIIVMENCGRGELEGIIQNRKKEDNYFTENEVLHYFVNSCIGLHEIHSHHVLHRDLKTNNIFVSDDNTPKIGDFGISKVLEHTTNKASTAVGTPYYLSPEVCKGQRYSWKSDIWALGVILYELCTFNHPFEGNNLMCLVFQICANDIPKIPSEFHPDMASLVKNLLNKDENTRPTTEEIFRIPIVEKYMNNMRKRANRQIIQQQKDQQVLQDEVNSYNVSLAPAPMRPLQQFSPNTTNTGNTLNTLNTTNTANGNQATRRIFETSSDNPLSMKTTQIRRNPQQMQMQQQQMRRPQSQANSIRPLNTSQNFNNSSTNAFQRSQQQQQQQTRIIYPNQQPIQQQNQQTVILHNMSNNNMNESKLSPPPSNSYDDRPITAKGKYILNDDEVSGITSSASSSKIDDYPPTRATPIGKSPRVSSNSGSSSENRPISAKGSYPFEKRSSSQCSNSKLPNIKPINTSISSSNTTSPHTINNKANNNNNNNNNVNININNQEEYYRLHPEERPLTGHGSYFPPRNAVAAAAAAMYYGDDEYDNEYDNMEIEAELATSSAKLPVNATLVSPPKPSQKQKQKQRQQQQKQPIVVIEKKDDDDDFPSDFEDDFDAPEDVKQVIDNAQDSRENGPPPPSEEVRQVDRSIELKEELGEILYQSMYDYFKNNDKVSIPDIQLKFGKSHIDKAQLIQMIVLKDKLKNQ